MLKKEGVKRIAIFGSYAREEESPQSDIDVMVKFKPFSNLYGLSECFQIGQG
ncbi:nucleotidyltransferase domain-containing protein [candidate division WOR-3 bacterium]|nr:nucleotidyltransferase domain-containing protein [candidate division WOR-3 bacterium]